MEPEHVPATATTKKTNLDQKIEYPINAERKALNFDQAPQTNQDDLMRNMIENAFTLMATKEEGYVPTNMKTTQKPKKIA